MKLLGISGKKGHGKNAVADILQKNCNKQQAVYTMAFADSLKEEVAKGCGVTLHYLNQNKDNFRLILQGWGTDFRRKLNGEDYWTLKFMQKLVAMPNESLVVVTDVRFKNEAELIKKAGGQLWRIQRSEFNRNPDADTHPSEIALDDYEHFDHIINNNDNLNTLKTKVVNLYNETYNKKA